MTGQGIPPGLHVRMNLETGMTEAKLLDEETESDSQSAVVSVDQSNVSPVLLGGNSSCQNSVYDIFLVNTRTQNKTEKG